MTSRRATCQLPRDAQLQELGQGADVEKVACVSSVEMSVTQRFDNRSVTFSSTFVYTEPLMNVRTWIKVDNEYKQISCPKVISIYNKHMRALTA